MLNYVCKYNSLFDMPFHSIPNKELSSVLFGKSKTLKDDICKNNTFFNNTASVCDNSVLKELEFAYCIDDEFNRMYKCESGIEFSVFHMNIRSLNKNHRGLLLFLHSLNLDFDVIVLSEIWNYNLEFYHNIFVNYNFHFVVSETSKVGGVGIFVKNTFVVHELEHLQIPSTADSMIENLWLEIIRGNRKWWYL